MANGGINAGTKPKKPRRGVGISGRLTPQITEARKRAFLAALSQSGIVSTSCEIAGLNLSTVYRYRQEEPAFADEWANALTRAAGLLESEARRRAVEGYEEPVYQQGHLVGYVRKYSDSLLNQMLKARVPEYKQQAPTVVVGDASKKERDPALLAKKIAFALAVAQNNQKKQEKN